MSHAPTHGGPVFLLHDHVERYEAHGETTHTEHGLTCMVEGWHRMEHGGPIEARAGTFTLVPAGVPHRALDGRDMEYWLLAFCPTCLGLDEGHPLMSPFRRVRLGALPVFEVAEGRRRKVVRLFRELEEELGRASPETRQRATRNQRATARASRRARQRATRNHRAQHRPRPHHLRAADKKRRREAP